jgi:predicted membrane-bound spermidine synthase
MNSRIRILYFLFAASGFCGLIYESIWSRYLGLFLGHASYAQTVVLIVFIGGLALGSWLAGLFALRLARPLLAYAAAELLVGLAALGFQPFFVHATDWAYAHLLPAACSADHWCVAQWVFAGLLILPQSVLLGTTFPLMSGGVLRLDAGAAGRKLSFLYFLNSIGAVAGVLASGYLLVPKVGLPGTLATAGLMNVALALAVYFVDKDTAPAPAVAIERAADAATVTPAFVRLMLAIALLTGLSSFIYEVAWIRSLSLVLGASSHSFELMLAAFILGIALGGLWIRGRIDRIVDVLRYLGIVQVTMGLLALATLPAYNQTFDLMAWFIRALRRTDEGWILFNLSSSVICLLVMLPATFMAGMTLPLITLALLRTPLGEKSIGHVYAANTLGGIVGVAVAIHFALPVLGLKGALVLGGAIDVALGIWLLMRPAGERRGPRVAWSAAGVLGLLVAALFFHLDPLKLPSGVFNFGRARLLDTQILSHEDGRTATVDVFLSTRINQVAIATNGKVDGAIRRGDRPSVDEYTMLLLGGLAVAERPDARNVAVIGYGTGMSTTVVLGSPRVQRVDTIEIEPAMLRGAEAFRFFTDPAYTDPRSHFIVDDAKSYFARSGRRYDLILSEPSNPWVSGVSSLFSREFYARVRSKLDDNGLLVQWLHTYSFSDPLLASILKAMRESFPHFVLYDANGGDLVVIASPSGPVPPPSPEVFALGRLPQYFSRMEVRRPEDLAVRRVGDQDTVRALFATLSVAPNSDYFPIVDTGASRTRFLGEQARGIAELGDAPWPILEMTTHEKVAPATGVTFALVPSAARVGAAGRAWAGRDLLLGRTPQPGAEAVLGDFKRTFALFRARFIECHDDFPATQWWDVVQAVGQSVSVFLPPEASAEIWQRVRSSACFAKLSPVEQNWFALFDALGRRDAGAAAASATQALATARSEEQLAYFYGAAMTALISANRMDVARALYERYHHQLSTAQRERGWFRWVEGCVLLAPAAGTVTGGRPAR